MFVLSHNAKSLVFRPLLIQQIFHPELSHQRLFHYYKMTKVSSAAVGYVLIALVIARVVFAACLVCQQGSFVSTLATKTGMYMLLRYQQVQHVVFSPHVFLQVRLASISSTSAFLYVIEVPDQSGVQYSSPIINLLLHTIIIIVRGCYFQFDSCDLLCYELFCFEII